MKPSHLHTPRTLEEGQFAKGYTTQPVGRKARPKWVEKLASYALAVGLGLVLGMIMVVELSK